MLPLRAKEAAQGGFSLDSFRKEHSVVAHILALGVVPLVLLASG